MATVFSITAALTSLRTDAQGRAECSFTVSNTAGRPLRGRAEVKATDPAQQGWLSLVGDPQRNFAVGGTDQVSVKVAAPPGSPAGKHSFRLDVVSAQNPDEDFAEGPTVSFEVGPSAATKTAFPWWIIAVAAVLLIGVGVGLYFWLRPKPEEVKVPPVSVPNVVGMQLEEAKFALSKSGLKFGQASTRLTDGGATGKVLSQNPAAGSPAPPGTEVQVETAQAGAKIPDVVGKPGDEAKQMLAAAGLRLGGPFIQEAKSAAEDGKVQKQTPPAGTLVLADSVVDLQLGMLLIRGVQAPNVVDLNRADAEAKLAAAGLTLGKVDFKLAEPGTGPKVVEQHPGPADGTVAQGTKVDLVVAEAGVRVPDVGGAILTAAVDTLRRASLTAKEASRTLAVGKAQDAVLSQLPKAGDLVKTGSAVELALANAGTSVPNVVGFTLDGAKNALQGARLQAREVSRSSAGKPPGAILDQDQPPGSLVTVNTVVSIGVNALVEVPDVVGMNVAAARSALAKANLPVGWQTTRSMDSGVTGTVLTQNPGSKSWVVPFSAVQLETADVKPKPIGCDGVAGSGKVLDTCGVCGGANACQRPCPAQAVELGNSFAFIYLDLPQTSVGVSYSWSDVGVYSYHFPLCYRVAISSLRYSCSRTPTGGVWQQFGNVARTNDCFNFGNRNQTYMRTKD